MTWQPFTAAVVMSLVAWLISRTLYRRGTPSLKRVAVTLLVTSLIMTALGVLLFIALYAIDTAGGLAGLFADDPLRAAWHFLKLGLLTAFFWMPILLFTALSQARRVPYRDEP
jgi:hypothetical protein